MRAGERYAWRALGYPFLAFFILFPVGIFLGGVTQLASLVCRNNLVTQSGRGARALLCGACCTGRAYL